MQSGIYCIYCHKSNLVYIGSSRTIATRLGAHKNGLRKNRHKCAKLGTSFKRHGEPAFQFLTLESCCLNDLLRKEQYWIVAAKQIEGLTVVNRNAAYARRIRKANTKPVQSRVFLLNKKLTESQPA